MISYIYNQLQKTKLRKNAYLYSLLLNCYQIKERFSNKSRYENFKTVVNQFNWEDLHKISAKKQMPDNSAIEITNACNLNCVMCNTQKSRRKKGYMNLPTFKIILQQLKANGISFVSLHTVGETLMHKGLVDLLKVAKDYKFTVTLSTNGQFPSHIKDLYRQIPDMKWTYRFSIDGATGKTYEFLRKGASFKKLMESLEVTHRINSGMKGYRISLSIGVVLSLDNIFELPMFFKVYGRYCFPEKINFHLANGVSPDQSYVKKAVPFTNLMVRYVPCSLPFGAIIFTYDGKVTLCCRDYEGELVVGDIMKDSIENIWNGENAESIREMHLFPEKMSIAACKSCFGPNNFVNDVVNMYIHFLHIRYPRLSSKEFGDKVVNLLNNMDHTKEKSNLTGFKQCILDAFK